MFTHSPCLDLQESCRVETNQFLENDHQKPPTYGHVTELFLESEFQHKGNKQMKNANSKPNIAVFSEAIDSQNKIIQILHRKGQKIKLDRIVIVRTGTYL